MISENEDPRGVCRGKRGVRKREDGAGREREKEGERAKEKRKVKKKNNHPTQCTG